MSLNKSVRVFITKIEKLISVLSKSVEKNLEDEKTCQKVVLVKEYNFFYK